MENPFPELDNEAWKTAIDSATQMGQQGLVRALRMTTMGISNARSQIGTNISHLKNEIVTLNKRLDDFNKSSDLLTKKALNLTKWIMIATVVSSIATLILAIDVIVRWVHI